MTKLSKIKFATIPNIAKNLVLIDGLARCGKSLFSNIISSLKDFEQVQFFNIFEHVIPGIRLGGLSLDFGRTLLNIQLNELIYNISIARNVNFRFGDQTGVWNYKDPEIYFKRLARAEGDEAVGSILRRKAFTPFVTHELITNLSILEKLGIDYRMVEVIRNPIDISYSWWKRGWGKRFGMDPRAFTLVIDHKKKIVPWYNAENPEPWLCANAPTRCILTVIEQLRRSVEEYKKSDSREKIQMVVFEEFVQRPGPGLMKICSFLGTKPTKHTARFVKAANCPRSLNPDDLCRKMQEFRRAGVSRKLLSELDDLADRYASNRLGLISPQPF